MFTTTTNQQNALSSRSFTMALFAELNFSGGYVRASTWSADLTWGTYNWVGLGKLVSVADVKETEKLETSSVDLTLNAADNTILVAALGDPTTYRGRSANIYTCPLADGVLIDTPILCWSGTMDTMNVVFAEGGGSVVVRCKPTSDKLNRPTSFRVNHEQQKLVLSTDLGFQYQQDLIANPQIWLSKAFQRAMS